MSKFIFETSVGDIAGIVHGDKANPLILVLHGYGERSSIKNWNYIFEPLSNLGYLVVGVDMPGFGKSPGKRYKSRSEYMRIPGGPVDVVEEIMSLLDKPSAYLLGYDWGAGIAISAAIKLNNAGSGTPITGLMLFHIAYTQQQQDEIARFIDPESTKTLLLWVDTEQNHPIKILNNEWKTAFKGSDCTVFQCRPYSPDKPKQCYQVISDLVIGTITEWIQQNPPKTTVNDDINGQNEVERVESKQNEQETVNEVESVDAEEAPESVDIQSVDVEEVAESEDTKQSEVVVQSANDNEEQIESQQMVEEQNENEQNENGDQIQSVIIEEEEEKKEAVEPPKKRKKRKKTMSGVRVRKIETGVAKHEMKCDYGELVVIDTRGGKVVVNIVGDPKKGKPYICFHGWGHDSWSRDIQWQFESLSKMGYFIMAPDMPGFGRSDGERHCSRSETNFDEGGPVEIVEDILSHFGFLGKRINVYGYSWGGGIAISLALLWKHKKTIERLVLFCASYTEQKRKELTMIPCSKILLMWVPIDLVHPITLGRYFHQVFPKHEYHEIDCGKYVRFNYKDGKHQWEKHSAKTMKHICKFMK